MDLAEATLEDMKNAILSDPCILHFDYRKLSALHTNFCSHRFGWMLCQPGEGAMTNQVVHNYQAGERFFNDDQGLNSCPPPGLLWRPTIPRK